MLMRLRFVVKFALRLGHIVYDPTSTDTDVTVVVSRRVYGLPV